VAFGQIPFGFVQAAYRWVHRVAWLLENKKQLPAAKMRRGLSQILTQMRQATWQTQGEAVRGQTSASPRRNRW
jgi:hypothetical protein